MQLFTDLQKKGAELLTQNASALLTAGGVIGTVATAVLSARATVKAAEIIRDEELKHIHPGGLEDGPTDVIPEGTMGLSPVGKAKLVWPHFIPPVIVGGATIASIVMANRLSAQHAAALAAAYGVSAKQRDEYKAKLEQKLGMKKAEEARVEIQEQRVAKNPLRDNMIIVGTGPVLCYDSFSDRYFKSTADHIRKAVQVVNGEIDTGQYCKLDVFYNELELPDVQFGDMLGWNTSHPCSVSISTMLINDSEACLTIEFNNLPMPNYGMDYD